MEKDRLLFHHSMSFQDVRYDVFVPDPERGDPLGRGAHAWLAEEVGFWPVFNSVGETLDAIYPTGYDTNWIRRVAWSPETGTVLRKAGEYPDQVLFSFDQLDGVFMDYDYWFLVLNAGGNRRDIGKRIGLVQRRWIFKPAWSRRKWIRYSLERPGSAMMVCPELDLRTAGRVWVRNRKTKRALQDLGFTGVEVKRIPVLRAW